MKTSSKGYFNETEVACQHCGELIWDEEFIGWLDTIREEFGLPMRISSWYRCPEHPIEARKSVPGAHATGRAVDVLVSGEDALDLTAIAYRHGCRRIGWSQKGNHSHRFVHLDLDNDRPEGVWSY